MGWFLALLIALQLLAWIFDFQFLTSTIPESSKAEEIAILKSTNEFRAESGVESLRLNPQLSQAAESKAQHMIDNQYWAHTSPDGVEPWEFLTEKGYAYALAGENLARGYTDGETVVAAWQSSDAHRQNQLNTEFTEIGVGSAVGELFGRRTYVTVAMYAKPAQGVSIVNQSAGQKQINIDQSTSEFVGLPSVATLNINNPLNNLNNLSSFGLLAIGIISVMILIHLLQDTVTRARNIQWMTKKHQHPWLRIALLSFAAFVLLMLSSGSI